MEEPLGVQTGGEVAEKPNVLEKQTTAGQSESAKRVPKTVKPSVVSAAKVSAATGSVRKRMDSKAGPDSTSTVMRPTVSASLKSSNAVPVARRNSIGGLPEKRPNNGGSVAVKKTTTPLGSQPVRRSLPELRRSSLPSPVTKSLSGAGVSETRKSVPVAPLGRSLNTSTGSDVVKQETVRKSSVKPVSSVAYSSSRRVTSTSLDSSGNSGTRKTVSKVSSASARSPSVSSGLRAGSLSSSLDRSSISSGRRKVATPESRDSRFIVLPQVEIKAGDEVVSTMAKLSNYAWWFKSILISNQPSFGLVNLVA